MLNSYKSIFQIRGSYRVSISGFIARFPMAMDSIAIIYFVQSIEKSYFIAGALAATAALTSTVSIPLWAKAADKMGQRRVIVTAIPLRVLAFLVFIYLVHSGFPKWSWFLCIFIAESASLSIGSMSRRRWVHMLNQENKSALSTAFALESLLDELIFIAGPIITTSVVSVIDPMAGIVSALFFLVLGGLLLATHKHSEPKVVTEDASDSDKSVFKSKSLQAIALPLTLAGGSFSAINICVVAFTDERGVKHISGLLLGLWALGGAISALINGALHWKISHGKRFILYLFGMTLVAFTFPFMHNVWSLGCTLFIQGMCIAPLLPNGLPMVTESIHESRLTQAITLTTAGIPLTGALGSFIAGRIIDSYGASTGLWLPFIFLSGSCLTAALYLKQYKI